MTETVEIVGNRYALQSTLGRGGYGIVYAARDQRTGQRVAIKELTSLDPRSLARFKREFRAVQEVHHPNLVRLDALFEDQGKWMIAMELVEGDDLLTYVYEDGEELSFNETRVREAFSQLAEGLEALHEAGFVHRDLKPANVRVTAEGRAVLLDFGLAIAADPRAQAIKTMARGTAAYMAPEQVMGDPVGPAADWYAFGVCLYQAITGVTPIDADSSFALLQAKRAQCAPPAASQVPGIPQDLDQLCSALLLRDPGERPRADRIRSALLRGARPLLTLPAPALPSSSQIGAFSGREGELDLLRAAADRAATGLMQIVLVEGESGIGKSALVEKFLDRLDASWVALRSRCYENELLPYKAFDGAVDGIVQLLLAMQPTERAALLTPKSALCCRLFPVFKAIEGDTEFGEMSPAEDPSTQRREAFAEFARLLGALGERNPLVLAIDDLQWADPESFTLLESCLGERAIRCLCVATVRGAVQLSSECAAAVAQLRTRPNVTTIALDGLDGEHARLLARRLMGTQMPQSWVDMVVVESGGHPLFLTVLARYAESHDPASVADLTLDAAIGARLGGLPRDARELISLIAVVGLPLPVAACGRALGLEEIEVARLVTDLCRQKLLRRRRAGEVACFHDRIRQVAVERLPLPHLQRLHGRVAAALALDSHVDRAELARHHEAAGELQEAYQAYRAAAERSAASFAFAQSAQLLERAALLAAKLSISPAERAALHVARAQALSRAGRSADAARAYLEASALLSGEQRIQLRIFAAQHLLQGARVQEGIDAVRALCAELGVPLASTGLRDFVRSVFQRAFLRSSELETSAGASLSPAERTQLDALWELAMPLAWFDPQMSAALSAHHLRLARAAGEPAQLARALGEVAFDRLSRDPDDRRAPRLLTRACELASEVQNPAFEVGFTYRQACAALLSGDFSAAGERFEYAGRVARESGSVSPWLLTTLRLGLASVWVRTGEHGRLASETSKWLALARERDDRFALTFLEAMGALPIVRLMRGELAEARERLESALSHWPRTPFSVAHYEGLFTTVQVELYEGGEAALRFLGSQRDAIEASGAMRTIRGRATLLAARCAALLAACQSVSADRRGEVLADLHVSLRKLSAFHFAVAACHMRACSAQYAALIGDRGRALHELELARKQGEAAGYLALTHALTYLTGQLAGGEQGDAQKRTALAFFAAQGWSDPRRAIAIFCPGALALEREYDASVV